MSDHLTVALLNIYAANKTPLRGIRAVMRHNPDSIGFNEGYNVITSLATRKRYRLFYGEGGRDSRRGAMDTPVLTRKRWKSLGTMALQASEQSTPEKLAPDRWITVSCYSHPLGDIAHVNLHPNAAVMNRDPSVPRVREYAESMDTLDAMLGFLAGEEFLLVVTGDVNFRKQRAPVRPDHSPYEVFARHKLASHTQGVDVIAWSRDLRKVRAVNLPKSRTGSDHPGLVITLARK